MKKTLYERLQHGENIGDLASRIEANEAFWSDDYGRVVALKDEAVKKRILFALATFFEMLQKACCDNYTKLSLPLPYFSEEDSYYWRCFQYPEDSCFTEFFRVFIDDREQELPIQTKREVVIKNYLDEKGRDYISKLRREDVWAELAMIDESLFRPTGKDVMSKTFTDCRKTMSFPYLKRGRP